MKRISARKLTHRAVRLLRFGLPFIAVELVYLALSISGMSGYDTLRLRLYIFEQLEHIIMALTLLIGGAFLLDLTERGY